MGLLSRHVSQFKSEEFVLGVSAGFKGDDNSKFAGIESTKITVVSMPSQKNWTGYKAIDQVVASEAVGKSMIGKPFPARCMVTYERVPDKKPSVYDGKSVDKDIERLVVVAVEHLSQVDLVDVKIAKAA